MGDPLQLLCEPPKGADGRPLQLGRSNGTFGDDRSGVLGAARDTGDLVDTQDWSLFRVLRNVDNGSITPAPDSRLGPYAATRGSVRSTTSRSPPARDIRWRRSNINTGKTSAPKIRYRRAATWARRWLALLLVLGSAAACAAPVDAPVEERPAARDGDLVRGILGARSVARVEDRSGARRFDGVADAIVA